MAYKFTINCLKFSSVGLFLLFVQFSFAQVNKKNVKELGIERFTGLDAKLLQNQKVLGGNVVAMVWADTLVYKRELGEFDSKAVVPIGYSSEWLTTALVLQLVDEGKISLDDKITSYLPDYAKYGKSYITIRHCLSHYTGIQSEPIILRTITNRKKYSSLEEEVNAFPKQEIQSNPGTEFRYSYIGIDIAARIVEIVSKKKFEMIIKQKLFNPLGMRQTSFATLDGSSPNPSGGAVSSANDYMQFLRMLLNNGVCNGQRILTEQAVKEMRTIQTAETQIKYTPKTTEGFGYTLGSWAMENRGNEATALADPGFFGTWPMVDWCRGYASLVMVKTLQGDQKKEIFTQMKDAIDDRLPSKCK